MILTIDELSLHFNTHIMTNQDPEIEDIYGTEFLFI
jgi:hypothetical protein